MRNGRLATIRRDPLARQDEHSGGHTKITGSFYLSRRLIALCSYILLRFSGWPRIMGDTYLRLIPLFSAIFYFYF
jgi:hypothetical protein